MSWMSIRQRFPVSHAVTSAIRECKVKWCKPSQSRAIKASLCFAVASPQRHVQPGPLRRAGECCRWARCFLSGSNILPYWVLEGFVQPDASKRAMSEQFTRPCCLLSLWPALAMLAAETPLPGPGSTGALRAWCSSSASLRSLGQLCPQSWGWSRKCCGSMRA